MASSYFLQVLLTVVEDFIGFLLIHEIKGKMGSHVTKSKPQQRLRFWPVVHAIGSEFAT
jgi:hypothetical protein